VGKKHKGKSGFSLLENQQEEICLKENLQIIKENLKATLDPRLWAGDITSDQVNDNIRRNHAIIALLTITQNLRVAAEDDGIKVVGHTEEIFRDSDIVIPDTSAAYMGMGGRVIMQFGQDDDPDAILPRLYGFENMSELNTHVSSNFDSPTEEQYIAPRFTSSHKVATKDRVVQEKRGFWTGVGVALGSLVNRKPRKLSKDTSNAQFGLNLAMFGLGNTHFQDPRCKGPNKFEQDKVVSPDGSFGHLLCVVNNHDGVIMMGIEKTGYRCAPAIGGDAPHNISAVSGTISGIGGFKHRKFESAEYEELGLVKPKLVGDEPIGAMVSEIDQDKLELIRRNQESYTKFAKAQHRAKEIGSKLFDTASSDVNIVSPKSVVIRVRSNDNSQSH